MKKHINLHGKQDCPFAWRTRLAAQEKDVEFDWLPCDVKNPDPKVAKENPDGHSPLMIHDWLTLTESMIICQYIDEAFPGRRLQNEDPAKRALERLAMSELDFDSVDEVSKADRRSAAAKVFESLEVRLRQTPWLGGEEPSLLDIKVAPQIAHVVFRLEQPIPESAELSRQYWDRWRARESYRRTCPSWAS